MECKECSVKMDLLVLNVDEAVLYWCPRCGKLYDAVSKTEYIPELMSGDWK